MELKLKWTFYDPGYEAFAGGARLVAWPHSDSRKAAWMTHRGPCADGEAETLEEAQMAAERYVLGWFSAGVEAFNK